MRCTVWGQSLDVTSFNAAISACEKGGQSRTFRRRAKETMAEPPEESTEEAMADIPKESKEVRMMNTARAHPIPRSRA
eukprot:3621977-Karenia_brevis.AAC.1